MHPRWSQGTASSRTRGSLRLAAAVLCAAVLAAGCGHAAATAGPTGTGASSAAGSKTASHKAVRCGTARTVANVPVQVEVAKGQAPCGMVMTIQRAYTKAVADGRAPGNGGGGPVTVRGWKCQGFPTPVVLRTGWASKCVRGGTEILAILPPPS